VALNKSDVKQNSEMNKVTEVKYITSNKTGKLKLQTNKTSSKCKHMIAGMLIEVETMEYVILLRDLFYAADARVISLF